MKRFVLKGKRGLGIVLPLAIVIVLIVLGLCLSFLVSHETKRRIKSKKSTLALYIADAGIETALYEFEQSTGPYSFGGIETFLPDSTDSEGSFIVSFSSSLAFPDRWVIESIGYVPNSASPRATRKIEAICEKPISVTSALAAGGNVTVGGNASIDGGTLPGVTYPPNATPPATHGSGTITGQPTDTATAPFPSFEGTFGITFDEMFDIAISTYTSPANNVPADGITWCDGDFQVTTSGWTGSGILVIRGDFRMTGGQFNGIIYVKEGSFDMSGGASIVGCVFSEDTADIELATGTSSITYSTTTVNSARELYPYKYKMTSWKEVL